MNIFHLLQTFIAIKIDPHVAWQASGRKGKKASWPEIAAAFRHHDSMRG
jgi:hypothetical protein